jgi:hypothetical protein
MKKCNKCKEGTVFSVNRYKEDGLSDTCKKCSKEITQARRRKLDVMLVGISSQYVIKFKKLHKAWKADGFTPHLKPVIVENKCVTVIESKDLRRSRKRGEVVCVGVDGKESRFESISHAMRSTGDSRLYIKWSSDTGTNMEGRNLWEIKK